MSTQGRGTSRVEVEVEVKVEVEVVEDKVKISELKNIKPFFRLNPPKGGFRRKTKKAYSDGGILGKNKELPDLVRRML